MRKEDCIMTEESGFIIRLNEMDKEMFKLLALFLLLTGMLYILLFRNLI